MVYTNVFLKHDYFVLFSVLNNVLGAEWFSQIAKFLNLIWKLLANLF